MDDHTKRAVAYIAGRLILKTISYSLYDYRLSKHFNFSGEVSHKNISIYDYELRCFISGVCDVNSFSLYHYKNQKHISLNINGNHFSGYDYYKSSNFSGTVTGGSISLYDYESSQYFDYTLQRRLKTSP